MFRFKLYFEAECPECRRFIAFDIPKEAEEITIIRTVCTGCFTGANAVFTQRTKTNQHLKDARPEAYENLVQTSLRLCNFLETAYKVTIKPHA